ncbi:MAG: hypothetical protein JWQ97_1727, partial [Phenylobacterium sp.]|nr:hypothetical protein [Phenylobacterium sp.]
EFMFHRPMAIGRPEQRLLPGAFGGEAKLHHTADGKGWRIVDDGGEVATFNRSELRYSLVWKALTFQDEAAAAVYDDHTDDLDADLIFQVFAEDLKARGAKLAVPKAPLEDRAFRAALLAEYPNPGTRHFADAKRG